MAQRRTVRPDQVDDGSDSMVTRREFINGAVGFGTALTMVPAQTAQAQTVAELERNKAVVRRFKESQGTKDEADAMKEVLAPNYKRWRAGFEHIGNNARDQGFPSPGSYLRTAFPDRKDTIEQMIAE